MHSEFVDQYETRLEKNRFLERNERARMNQLF